MSNKWIPEWANYFTLDDRTNGKGIFIGFYAHVRAAPANAVTYPINSLNDALLISDVCQQIKERPLEARMVAHNKYSREIKPNVFVDVYDTLAAFTGDVSSRIKPAVDHAIKKLLAPGKRGVKDERQDLVEARDSLDRAISQLDEWA